MFLFLSFEVILFMAKIITQDISIGSNLKTLRQKAGLSQEAAAAKLQIMGFTMSREVISQMELGKHNIRISVLLALRDIYNVQIQDFFEGL